MEQPLIGQVRAAQANFYRVITPAYGELLCTARARLKKTGQWVLVGDWVCIEEVDELGCRGAIAEILPRRSVLDQPPVANVDQLLLVLALADPPLETPMLSRFLVKAESTGLPFLLVLNKADLCAPEQVDFWREKVHAWGYSPFIVSTTTGQGLAELTPHLVDKVTVLAGPSGVGKSSLINCLVPGAQLATGSVAAKTGRGRHTTRHVQLLPLPQGGMLADTPGFSQPTLDIEPAQLARCFPEIRRQQGECEFSDCTHQDEPGCALAKDWERYEHYVEWRQELEELAAWKQAQGRSDIGVKYKPDRTEPKLALHKYRTVSRRRQHQELDLLTIEDE
ncbi:MAG: ribosome small subunit-dependent GTPase A [Gloeomargarita sp. SKYG116]|nr:ribosome small subunit-dependent GTPase A [Gloeomargarita sp. SKYG116]MDW8402181.1 ribosome small subunit-dependent GTPase A [Gloeomargarita sp. SKYGB_i_bin116]